MHSIKSVFINMTNRTNFNAEVNKNVGQTDGQTDHYWALAFCAALIIMFIQIKGKCYNIALGLTT